MLYPRLISKGVVMAVFNLTFFMRYEKWGWSYSFYKTATGDDPSAVLPPLELVIGMQTCHSNYVIFEKVRVTNVDKPRLSHTRDFAATFGTAGSTIAHPNYSVIMQLSNPDGARRLLHMRGMPLAWPVLDPVTGNTNLPEDAIQAFNINFGTRLEDWAEIRELEPVSVNPPFSIVSLSQSVTVPGYLAFQTAPDINLAVNDRVKIAKVDQIRFPGLNGEWKVKAKTGSIYAVDYKWLESGDFIFAPEGAYARKATYAQKVVKDARAYRVASRDTGRPSGLSRGRSRGVSARR